MPGYSYCRVGQWGTGITDTWAGLGQICNAHAVRYGPECVGTADVALDVAFAQHRHYAHNRCW